MIDQIRFQRQKRNAMSIIKESYVIFFNFVFTNDKYVNFTSFLKFYSTFKINTGTKKCWLLLLNGFFFFLRCRFLYRYVEV